MSKEEVGRMESRLHSIDLDFPNDGNGKMVLGFLVESVIMLNDRVKELEANGERKRNTNGW